MLQHDETGISNVHPFHCLVKYHRTFSVHKQQFQKPAATLQYSGTVKVHGDKIISMEIY